MRTEQFQSISLLTRKELAEFLNVPESWVDRAVSERRLPGVHKLGHRTVRFNLNKILQWLADFELRVINSTERPDIDTV